VNRQHFTAEIRVRSQDSPCGTCGGWNGAGTGFYRKSFGLPLLTSIEHLSILTHVIWRGWTMGRLAAAVPWRQSHPIVTIKKTRPHWYTAPLFDTWSPLSISIIVSTQLLHLWARCGMQTNCAWMWHYVTTHTKYYVICIMPDPLLCVVRVITSQALS
jgi:hypothetical protein